MLTQSTPSRHDMGDLSHLCAACFCSARTCGVGGGGTAGAVAVIVGEQGEKEGPSDQKPIAHACREPVG
jgi:hypothetical protein